MSDTDGTDGVAFASRMWAEDRASRALGMDVVTLEPGRSVVTMTVRDDMVNGHDICHGGFIFSLADSAFALACNSHGRLTVASGADITFVSPARLGEVLVAEAVEQITFGRNGISDVTVRRQVDSTVVAVFRGRSRSPGRS